MATTDTQPLTPDELVETLRALRERIPEYLQLPAPDARAARAVAHLNAEFKQAAFNAIGASDLIASAVCTTAEDLRQTEAEADHWSAAADELRALLQGVVAANLRRRQRVGAAALQAYSVTRQLVRHQSHSDLLPHLREMRRLNRLGHSRRRRPAEPAPAPPATVK